MREDEEKTFTVTFPEDYGETELAGQEVEFTATLRELRERRLPELDDDFAQSMGAFEDVAGLRADIRAAPRAQRARPRPARVRGPHHRVRRGQRHRRRRRTCSSSARSTS